MTYRIRSARLGFGAPNEIWVPQGSKVLGNAGHYVVIRTVDGRPDDVLYQFTIVPDDGLVQPPARYVGSFGEEGLFRWHIFQTKP